MRPRRIRRGRLELVRVGPDRARLASMRPRRIRRGRGRRLTPLGAGVRASMRPRRIRRGRAGRGRHGPPRHPRFNEAPANSPGKVQHIQTQPIQNIASMRPRRIRRGRDHRLTGVSWVHVASMRPRRIRRGRDCAGRLSIERRRRFNEAPANSPGKARDRAAGGRARLPASMRPRRIRRGRRRRTPRSPRGCHGASMRPRRIRREGTEFTSGP